MRFAAGWDFFLLLHNIRNVFPKCCFHHGQQPTISPGNNSRLLLDLSRCAGSSANQLELCHDASFKC